MLFGAADSASPGLTVEASLCASSDFLNIPPRHHSSLSHRLFAYTLFYPRAWQLKRNGPKLVPRSLSQMKYENPFLVRGIELRRPLESNRLTVCLYVLRIISFSILPVCDGYEVSGSGSRRVIKRHPTGLCSELLERGKDGLKITPRLQSLHSLCFAQLHSKSVSLRFSEFLLNLRDCDRFKF